jgi:hypothetical protein
MKSKMATITSAHMWMISVAWPNLFFILTQV